MFESYAKKMHTLVGPPRRLRLQITGEMDPAQEARLLALKPGDLTYGDYQWFFDCQPEVGLYYLPYAFSDLAEMRPDCDEYVGDTVRCVSGEEHRLREWNMLEDTFGVMIDVLDRWTSTYHINHVDLRRRELPLECKLSAAVVLGDARDRFLANILETRLTSRFHGELGPYMLRRWCEDVSHPQPSAHLLDMCMKAASYSDLYILARALYTSKHVQALLQDRALLMKHYTSAEKAWRDAGMPVWYICNLEGKLGISSK